MWKPGNWWTYFGRKAYKSVTRGLRRSAPRLNPPSLTFSIKFHKLIIYKPILDHMLNSPGGMVGRHLGKIGNNIAHQARLQVGKKSGRLVRTIRSEHVMRNVLGPGVKVGAYTSYALLHHQGTRPHLILPRRPGGALVFTRGVRIVHTRFVRHPGTKANRYLTDPMHRVVRGMR